MLIIVKKHAYKRKMICCRIVLTNVKLADTERHDISGSVFDSVNKYSIVEVIETGIRIFEISNNDTIKFITKTWAQLNA